MNSLAELEIFSSRNRIPSLNFHCIDPHQDPVVSINISSSAAAALSSSSPRSEATTATTTTTSSSRYENQKRRDWNTFGQYLKNHKPPLALSRCSGAHVLEFLRYLDQFGKTKVHAPICPFFGHSSPPAPCPCPLKQAWGSLDALIGRLRAAFEENGGKPEANPFGARAVRLYLREVRDMQSKARGISYEKKKKRKHHQQQQAPPRRHPPPPPPLSPPLLLPQPPLSMGNIPVIPPPVVSKLELIHGGDIGDVIGLS